MTWNTVQWEPNKPILFSFQNFEFWNIRRCVHTAVIMELLMWHSSVFPWEAAYGPQEKEGVCPKRENKVIKPAYHRQDVKRQI
jgi:hypothetical protein